MNAIEELNRWLGVRLGFINGAFPRFKWVHASKIDYFIRGEDGQPRLRCWAGKVGRVWLLAQWRPPDRFGPGRYHAHAETALQPGMQPTAEITRQLAWVLDQQLSANFQKQFAAVNDEIARDQDDDYVRWTDYVQDQNPAFANPIVDRMAVFQS